MCKFKNVSTYTITRGTRGTRYFSGENSERHPVLNRVVPGMVEVLAYIFRVGRFARCMGTSLDITWNEPNNKTRCAACSGLETLPTWPQGHLWTAARSPFNLRHPRCVRGSGGPVARLAASRPRVPSLFALVARRTRVRVDKTPRNRRRLSRARAHGRGRRDGIVGPRKLIRSDA